MRKQTQKHFISTNLPKKTTLEYIEYGVHCTIRSQNEQHSYLDTFIRTHSLCLPVTEEILSQCSDTTQQDQRDERAISISYLFVICVLSQFVQQVALCASEICYKLKTSASILIRDYSLTFMKTKSLCASNGPTNTFIKQAAFYQQPKASPCYTVRMLKHVP